MIRGVYLTTLVWGAVIILFVMLLLDGAQVTTGLFKPCGTVVTVLTLVVLAFDKWLWSLRLLHPWFVDRPYLKGTWKGVIDSNYVVRGMLKTILVNRWRNWRGTQASAKVEAGEAVLEGLAGAGETPDFEEAEYRRYLLHRAFELVKSEFPGVDCSRAVS